MAKQADADDDKQEHESRDEVDEDAVREAQACEEQDIILLG